MKLTAKVALLGNPNCGKTALFNSITGSRQKVGNYPGVTVERKEGEYKFLTGEVLKILDLPGTYSLNPRTPDEEIAVQVVKGELSTEDKPDAIIAVVDSTNLDRTLGLVLEIKSLGIPFVLALNMFDLATQRKLVLDLDLLSSELGCIVVPTVAVKGIGVKDLMGNILKCLSIEDFKKKYRSDHSWTGPLDISRRFQEVDRVLRLCTKRPLVNNEWTDRIDGWVLHPVFGILILFVTLILVFQTVFSWAQTPQGWIESAIGWVGLKAGLILGQGWIHDLVVDGIIAGVGSVVVFLPQILLLFFFILLLEDSGYMARAAFLMDRMMSKVGLHGRAFIPILSSYACAIPGVMATRTIENKRDRLTTIMVAPLATCSARLPVYTVLIAAFIPDVKVFGQFGLQGLVMVSLYAAGIIFAVLMAYIFKKTILKAPQPPLLLELPSYKWPSLKNIALGLWERSRLFLNRAGTVILTLSILIWVLSTFPKAPEGATEPAIHYSYAGKIGHAIEPVLKPLGFDWRVGVALVPGFAAREVMVSALATVYAVEKKDDEEAQTQALSEILAKEWTLPTALSLLVWYIFAMQCLSTVAVVKRETNSYRWPAFMLFYMTVLAYGGSWVTYHFARYLNL